MLAQLSEVANAINETHAAPEVILLAEPRPGVHRQAMVDALTEMAPLTRVVVVAGAWCEGELRSGKPLTGVIRLYCHQFSKWWRSALAARAAGTAPHWAAPIGAPQPIVRNAVSSRLDSQCIAIETKDFAAFEALASTLRPTGATCQWQSHEATDTRPPALGIWDGGQLDADELQRLAIFCDQFPQSPAPVLVLLDYPRAEHAEKIHPIGASALVGKPYSVDALISALSELADGCET
jgi:hypothetical protein